MWNLSYLGTQLVSQGYAAEAQATYAEADALLVELGPAGLTSGEFKLHQGEFANAQAQLANLRGHHAEAIRQASVSIRLQQANPKNWSGMGGHTEAGLAYLALGQLAEARDHFGQALQFAESVATFHAQAHLKWCLGRVELQQGRLARALEYCRASAAQASQLAELPVMAMALGTAAVIAAKQDQPHRAATLSGAAHSLYDQTRRHPAEDTNLDTLLPGWRHGRGRSAIERAYAAGQAMTNHEAIAFALSDALS
jgi:tetratricopeptide (TPR) repeat protein